MAYDEDLALRLQLLLAGEDGLTTKKMFGGLAFLIGGHLTVAASGKGGLMVRVDPAKSEALVARPHAERMVMGGRQMDGWLRVTDAGVDTDEELRAWIDEALEWVRTLPPQ